MKRTSGWLISRASTGENQAQFFGIAARVMRRILVDEARKRKSDKRGDNVIHVTLNEATNVGHEQAANVIALDDALRGTDEAVGSFGWEIDNVVFTVITNTPFPSVIADTTTCGP